LLWGEFALRFAHDDDGGGGGGGSSGGRVVEIGVWCNWWVPGVLVNGSGAGPGIASAHVGLDLD